MQNEWEAVTSLPQLVRGELQMWRIHFGDAGDDPDSYRRHLSPVEMKRSERLRAGQVRMQFVVARAALRVLLGNLLNLSPTLVPITLSAYGKPKTASVSGLPIFFNVAHSRETILIALCRSGEVGIDLEYLDRNADVMEIARNAFSSKEMLQIEQIADPTERRRAFFCCWTRKEALLKADGRGLSIPLRSVEVPVLETADWTPVLIPEGADSRADSRTWWVSDIAAGDEVTAAFAVGVPRLVLRVFSLSPELILGG